MASAARNICFSRIFIVQPPGRSIRSTIAVDRERLWETGHPGEAPNSTPSVQNEKRLFAACAIHENDTTMKVLVTGSAGHLGRPWFEPCRICNTRWLDSTSLHRPLLPMSARLQIAAVFSAA